MRDERTVPAFLFASVLGLFCVLLVGPFAPSVSADETPADPLPANLIVNPEFSKGTTGWSGLWTREPGKGRASVRRLSADKFERALAVEHDGDKDWSYSQDPSLPANPGEIYRYAGWVNASGGGRVELSVVLSDRDGKVMNWVWGLSSAGNTGGWKLLGRKFMVPAGAAFIRFRLTGWGPIRLTCSGLRLEKLGAAAQGPKHDIGIANAKAKARYSARDGKLTVTAPGNKVPFVIDDFGSTILPASLAVKNTSTLTFSVFNAYGDDARGEITLSADGAVAFALSGKGPMDDEVAFPGTWRAQPGTSWVISENEGLLVPADDPYYDQPWGKSFYSGHGGFSMPFIGLTDGTAGWLLIVETPDDASSRYAKPAGGELSAWRPVFQSSLGDWSSSRRVVLRSMPKGGYVGIAKAYRSYAKAKGLLVTLEEKAKLAPEAARLPGCVDLWFWKKAEWWQNEPDPSALAKELYDAGIRRVLWSSEAGPKGIAAMNKLGFLTGRYDIYQDVYPPGSPDWMARVNPEAWPSGLVLDSTGERITGWVAYDNGKEIKGGVVCSIPGLDMLKRHVDEDLKTHPYRARFIDTTTASPLRECWNPAHPTSRSVDREYKVKQLLYLSRDKKLVTGSETGIDWAVPALHYFEGMMSLGNFRLPDSGYDLTSVKTPQADFLRFQVGPSYRIPLFELVYHDCVVNYYYWGDSSNRLPDWWTVRDLYNALYGTGPLWIMDYERWERDKARFVQSYKTATEVSARTGMSEMLEHRFLTADHLVQTTRFANGIRVWINFGTEPYTLPTGRVLGGGGYAIE
ncbi:MAG: hypothetical protein JXD23_03715 [Spirochaetales bacterium]|nr:hypothetical protein [Spirochaetales bacterium]